MNQQYENQNDGMRLPPHSIDAEQSVIGGLLLDNTAFDRIGALAADDFYHGEHRSIFLAICHLQENGQPADFITVSDWLSTRTDNKIGCDLAYLGMLVKDVPSAANITFYADIVIERSQRRRLIAYAHDIVQQAYDATELAPGDLIDQAETNLFRIAESVRSNKNNVTPIKQALRETLDDIQKLSCRPEGELLGSATGFKDLDEILDGLEPGLIVVGARPAMGKTAFVGDLEISVAKQGKTVVSFNMEMPTNQLVRRYISKMSGVPLKKIRDAKLEDVDWVRITGAVKPMSQFPLYCVNRPGLTINDIRSISRKLQKESYEKTGQGLGLITIDYLQLISFSVGQGENQASAIGNVSRALKILQGELNVPIVLLSQLNRSLEQRPNKRPQLSDLRESGAIEQDGDIVIFVYRDEVYDEDSDDKGFAEIIISKQRNGPVGMIKLAFDGPCTRFQNPAFYEDSYHG